MKYLDIPIIINNRDQLITLVKLIEWLEEAGQRKIIILDNASSYLPLLEFYNKYENVRFTLRRLAKNQGPYSLWRHRNRDLLVYPFIYTDPDILPIEECPKDAVEFLFHLATEHFQEIPRVGFGLKIDDIPDYYPFKKHVLEWESKFWEGSPILLRDHGVQCFKAGIDTTFALHSQVSSPLDQTAIRTGHPYVARHLSWYVDPKNPPEDLVYYESRADYWHNWGIYKAQLVDGRVIEYAE